ncbi:MAG: hypothetical protein IPG50_04465 [Myxococcales bacterium]|nr:hypothetical protein [Myxococcales bacterium]
MDQFPADGGRPARLVRTLLPLCTKAKDAAACTEKAAVTPAGGWDPYGGKDLGPRQATPEVAITTRGDEVAALATLDALGIVLAPVETVDEAMLLAQLRGYRADGCGTEASAIAARAVMGGFEIAVVAGGGCSPARTGVVRRRRRQLQRHRG